MSPAGGGATDGRSDGPAARRGINSAIRIAIGIAIGNLSASSFVRTRFEFCVCIGIARTEYTGLAYKDIIDLLPVYGTYR